MTSAERATLIGLAQVTQRTEESARLRYLKSAEVADVLSNGVHGYKEVVVMGEEANSPGETKKLDEERASSADRLSAGAGSCLRSAGPGPTPTGQLESVSVGQYGSSGRKEGHARRRLQSQWSKFDLAAGDAEN
jgi:hypothetical protein